MTNRLSDEEIRALRAEIDDLADGSDEGRDHVLRASRDAIEQLFRERDDLCGHVACLAAAFSATEKERDEARAEAAGVRGVATSAEGMWALVVAERDALRAVLAEARELLEIGDGGGK